MKPCFQLWDSETANLVGMYESVSEVLADLTRTSTTVETRNQLRDLVLILALEGAEDESVVVLDGDELYDLCPPSSTLAANETGTPARSREYISIGRNSLATENRASYGSGGHRSYTVAEHPRETGNFASLEERQSENAGSYISPGSICAPQVA